MLIQLKQKQIEAALRGHIIKMGIDLKGRQLNITFVSGRKDNGLTADINFEDFPMEDDEVVSPAAETPVAQPIAPEPAPAAVASKPDTPAVAPVIKAANPFFADNSSIGEPDSAPVQELTGTPKVVPSLFI